MLYQKERFAEAKEAFLKAIELNPELNIPKTYLADILYNEQKYNDALQYYLQAYENSPTNTNILTKIGNVYKNLNNPDKALEYYAKALELEPNNITANINSALIYMNAKNNAKAREYSEVVIKEKPEYPLSYYINGVIADSEKKYEEAVTNYEKFINLAPTDKDVAIIKKRITVLKDYLKKLQGAKNAVKRDIR
jgi:tetratricopeptide (TPR) repeat protein